jgi:hypothetical protein
MSAGHSPIVAATARQEWNTRWIAILVATALIAGGLGYVAGGGLSHSTAFVLTGDAHAGTNQVSALAPDGLYYGIPVDGILWTDSTGSIHDNGRAECLPAAGKSARVTFAAVEWAAGGVAGRSVVWVDCRI